MRIGFNLADHRSSTGELGFAGLLAVVTVVVAVRFTLRVLSRADELAQTARRTIQAVGRSGR